VNPPVRTALIGVGSIGRRYFDCLRSFPGFDLAVAADVDPERLFAVLDTGFEHVTDDSLAAIAGESVEAVIVATPPSTHRALCIAALDAGRHVLVEKPLAENAEEAAKVERYAQQARATLSVAFNQRSNVAVERLRERIHTGRMGRIVELAIAGRIDRSAAAGGWLFDTAQGGGAVLEAGVHAIDLARWLTGQEFIRVSAEADVRKVAGGEYEHITAVLGRLSGGTIVRVSTSFGCAPPRHLSTQVSVLGECGDAHCNMDDFSLRFSHAGSASEDRLDLLRYDREIGSFGRQLRQWHRVIRDGIAPVATAADGLSAVVVAEAILRSARTGASVILDRNC
jgi:predicted dehydrogenase